MHGNGISKVAHETRKALGAVEGEMHEVTDLVEVSILLMFYIQHLGKASRDDCLARAVANGLTVNEHLADQALQALQARDFLSYARGRRASGVNVQMWRPKKSIWAKTPEVAQLRAASLLSSLVATDGAKELIAQLNRNEEEPEGVAKARRALGYDRYVDVQIEFLTLDVFLGSQPKSPLLDGLLSDEHAELECDLRFARNHKREVILPPDVIRGWLRTSFRNRRPKGLGDTLAQYIGVTEGVLKFDKLVQQVLPIIDMRSNAGGRGILTYEAIEPGATFTVLFRIPTKGFMLPMEFVKHVAAYGPLPIRGLSPARGARYGQVAVKDFTVFAIDDARAPLELAASRVPASVQAIYTALLAHNEPKS